MIINLINKLKSKKAHFQNLNNFNENTVESSIEVPTFDINIINEGNFLKVEISDYISIKDYVERMKEIDTCGLIDLISNHVLWNVDRQKVNKGAIYIIQFVNQLYNILINGKDISIDERITIEDIIEEKVINIDIDSQDYRYSSLKHYQTGFTPMGSTFYVKGYNKGDLGLGHFSLSKEEAYVGINAVIDNLRTIEKIENIIDLDLLEKIILDDLNKNYVKQK